MSIKQIDEISRQISGAMRILHKSPRNNNRQPKSICLSRPNGFYNSVGVGAHDDPRKNAKPLSFRPSEQQIFDHKKQTVHSQSNDERSHFLCF